MLKYFRFAGYGYKTVIVMMSTYNGEKYICKQLDSILNQQSVNIILAVRDDGSTDHTLSILEQYRKKSAMYLLIGKNIGYKKSFFTLVRFIETKLKSQSDENLFFSFADQDDVWLKNKLYKSISHLSSQEPMLYFSALNIVDSKLKKIGYKSYKSYRKTLGSALCMSSVAGCTMVFNKQLFFIYADCLDKVDQNQTHDSLLYLINYLFQGKVIYSDESDMLFRRHFNNASTGGVGFGRRVKTAYLFIFLFQGQGSRMANNLLKIITSYSLEDSLQNNDLKLITKLAVRKKSIMNRFLIIFNRDFKTNIQSIDFIMKLTVLLNRY